MSRGDVETLKLKENIESQLERLLTQLKDLEDLKEDLDQDEYDSSRQETIDQLKQFEASLANMVAGNMSLVDEIGSVQLTIQSAIRSNTSPEILNMFMKKENASLRSRLASLESDLRLNKIPKDSFNTQAVDILKMLEKLGEELTPAEKELLNKNTKDMSRYVEAGGDIDQSGKIMASATKDIGISQSK